MNIQIFGTKKGMSKGKFTSVAQANGGIEEIFSDKDSCCKNGKQSTLGYCPEVWKGWN